MKMTSAYANKLIKKLQGDREYWREIENQRQTYIETPGEEPVIPEYNFFEVHKTIADIDNKILRIRHAINVSNSINTVEVGGEFYTIDMVLVKMAQMTERRAVLGAMRKLTPRARVLESAYGRISKAPTINIECINFDMNAVKEEFDYIDNLISELQLALDKYNQIVEIDVDI